MTDSAGRYDGLNLPPGDYEVSVAAPGFSTTITKLTITTSGRQTVNLSLRGQILLEDIGFAQAQGSAADQARLDKRSHMLKLHQTYGLIATIPLAFLIPDSARDRRLATIAKETAARHGPAAGGASERVQTTPTSPGAV